MIQDLDPAVRNLRTPILEIVIYPSVQFHIPKPVPTLDYLENFQHKEEVSTGVDKEIKEKVEE